ncbi:HlyD family efflux transporter periplasmic adaptor subunit [Paracrocinitomix mangrovi]|uniref:HlyD family secretion protein n=1 Tax=Paracrocinitomix mangrovi TaxID=2862509 RepID=UPI001C8D962F|nr:HlyD family efflux transporter periplasmic adaptor subunit [Paracrocinitomix mangrovi]UKN00180.1 HlyD family efflux transporter periplasmic adaptor subunit [Paracrocinitomix mangrovi]
MLNISEQSIGHNIRKKGFKTLTEVEGRRSSRVLLRLIGGTFLIGLIIMFVPWTQNIRSYGSVTTLKPDQRPQTIHSVIAGRIEKWYVQEGDEVKAGDTIAFISEVKDDYFDPQLLDRTQNQTELKQQMVNSYDSKIDALDDQINSLQKQRQLELKQGRIKISQAHLKVSNDSINFQAAQVNYETAEKQYKRFEELHDQGLKSKTDLENRRVKMQESYSSLIAAENKYLASQSDLIAAEIELSNIQMKYQNNLAKAESDKFSAFSAKFDSEGQVTKLQNQYSNYQRRNSFYYITAPQDCYITRLVVQGVGETVKEGGPVVTIMPTNHELAAEIYIDPIDLPLVTVGENVRIQFDGWPAVIFSGWPNASYGTYGGTIYAIDKFISDNGKFRVLIKQDPNDHPWPEALKYGGGANAMILLGDVPIWYELWRKINGFPPNYYKAKVDPDKETKAK